jgi:hypothetical protein
LSYDESIYRSMKSRWKSGDHVGDARPLVRGYIRTTRLKRTYETVSADEIYATIPGLPDKIGDRQVWKGRWHPLTPWAALPPILDVKDEHTFDANGVQTATIEVENIGVIEHSSVLGGIFHTFERGYYSPWRGFDPKGRRAAVGEKNDWYDVLADKSTEIMVVGGYGDAVFPLFNGLVNDLDLESRPDRITITARSSGQVVTDQPVFINAKVRHVKDPITFCDRLQADKVEDVAQGADASDWQSGFNPTNVVDDSRATRWRSDERDNATPADMPWLQIAVPNGRYEDFTLTPTWGGMSCYIAIKARDLNAPGGQGARRHIIDTHYADNEWIDEGHGNVPGTGIPYVKRIDNIKVGAITHQLPDYGYDLGDDSVIRLYFSDLDYRLVKGGEHRRAYFAGVDTFQAHRRTVGEEARRNDWILIDDLADAVKLVFQWCGINDFEVETTGVRLRDKAVFNRGNFLVDIIKAAADQVGYVFYFKPPESFDEDNLDDVSPQGSMGIGVFRQNQAMRGTANLAPGEHVEEVRDDQLLTEPQARFTDEPLAYNIRVRGKQVKETKGGRVLGADDTSRWMYVYRPPWSRDTDYRNANIKKYVVHHDNMLRNLDECKLAALFIAFREALEAGTAVIAFPCLPTIHLDQQIGLFDTGIGISSRIWIASRQLDYTGGPKGHFKMSIGGSLIDLPDITKVRKELVAAIGDESYNPGLSHWEQTHYGSVYHGTDDD